MSLITTRDNAEIFCKDQSSDQPFVFHHDWLDTDTWHLFSFANYQDPARMHWGALRIWTDDVIQTSTGFPPHSEMEMEIITYVREGGKGDRPRRFVTLASGIVDDPLPIRADTRVLDATLGELAEFPRNGDCFGDRAD